MLELTNNDELPPIPPKRYFTIGEVGELCSVKPHVLRYWEAEFPQLKPVKRRGNRRYYQRQDVILIREIKKLLYEKSDMSQTLNAHIVFTTSPQPMLASEKNKKQDEIEG